MKHDIMVITPPLCPLVAVTASQCLTPEVRGSLKRYLILTGKRKKHPSLNSGFEVILQSKDCGAEMVDGQLTCHIKIVVSERAQHSAMLSV